MASSVRLWSDGPAVKPKLLEAGVRWPEQFFVALSLVVAQSLSDSRTEYWTEITPASVLVGLEPVAATAKSICTVCLSFLSVPCHAW